MWSHDKKAGEQSGATTVVISRNHNASVTHHVTRDTENYI